MSHNPTLKSFAELKRMKPCICKFCGKDIRFQPVRGHEDWYPFNISDGQPHFLTCKKTKPHAPR